MLALCVGAAERCEESVQSRQNDTVRERVIWGQEEGEGRPKEGARHVLLFTPL